MIALMLAVGAAGCASKQDLPQVGTLDDYVAQSQQQPDPYGNFGIDPFWLATCWYPIPVYYSWPGQNCHYGICENGHQQGPGGVAVTAAGAGSTTSAGAVQSAAVHSGPPITSSFESSFFSHSMGHGHH